MLSWLLFDDMVMWGFVCLIIFLVDKKFKNVY